MLSALVLAGSRGRADPVADYAGVSHKALIELAGETLLARVAAALKAAGATRIVVSANDPEVIAAAQALGLETMAAEGGPSQSVAKAAEALGTPLLITTSDHALLQAEWVSAFLADTPATADVAVMLARRELIEAAAPGTRRTYLKLADGDWSGCNLFLLATPRSLGAVALWRRVEADRKRPWRIAGFLGLPTLFAYITGRLTMAGALARLGRLADVDAAVVPSRFGLAAIDVDKPSDLDLVREMVEV